MEAELEPAFHLFRFLPAELRLQIWRLSLPPRVILLSQSSSYPPLYISPTPQPTLLSVCHESRVETLRSLILIPGINVYFNPGLDILYHPRPASPLGYSTPVPPLSLEPVRELVTKVAVDYVSAESRKEWEVYNKYSFLKSFPNLDEGYLVINTAAQREAEGASSQREIELIDPRGDRAEIMGIMERVRESFCYELPPPSPQENEEEPAAEKVEQKQKEEKEKWVDGRIEYNGLELVAKAMVVVGVCG